MSLSLVLYDAEKARENALQELNILVSREKLSEALACCDELLESLDETNDLGSSCSLFFFDLSKISQLGPFFLFLSFTM
jgi:hypothetical protein